jgi:putative tricarboxylic transport membrane protein
MFEKEIRKLEGFFWIGIGVIICILALQFDLGAFRAPGAGFVAFLSGLFISCVGLVMIVSNAVSKNRVYQGPDAHHPFRISSWVQLIYTMGLLVTYIALIEPVGFILTTFLLMFGLFFDHEKRNWAWSLLFSTVTAAVSYMIFEVWLRCQLPRGIFPWW